MGTAMITTPPALLQDNAKRTVRSAIWIALEAAQRAEWRDLVEQLFELHTVVNARLNEIDLVEWRRQLDAEGPHQPESY